jgi:hypothetical protein
MRDPFETEFYGWFYGIGFQVNNTIIKDDRRRVNRYLNTQYNTLQSKPIYETRIRIIRAWDKLIKGE